MKKFPSKKVKNFLINTVDRKIIIDQPGQYQINLTQPDASVTIEGRFAAHKQQKLEVSIVIHHSAPHTSATTELRGVATDQSFIKFEGRIVIAPDCPDTQSFLTERILLIGDQARAEAIPDLEIESDDVKCSHAASISTLDEEQLFYLMSRGIAREKAERLLINGFLGL